MLRFYRVYRALVRAKVHALRAAQEGICTTERERLITASRGYIDLAQRCARDRQPAIILMHGLSGAGKSMLAQALAEHTGAIRLRSDVERKRISDWALASGLYTADLTSATYHRLRDLARLVANAGYAAIVDVTAPQAILCARRCGSGPARNERSTARVTAGTCSACATAKRKTITI